MKWVSTKVSLIPLFAMPSIKLFNKTEADGKVLNQQKQKKTIRKITGLKGPLKKYAKQNVRSGRRCLRNISLSKFISFA